MSVRIGIDARKFTDSGIGRTLQGLLPALAQQPGDEQFVLFHSTTQSRDIPASFDLPLARFERIACDAPLYSLRELFELGNLARTSKLDLLHLPHYLRPWRPNCPISVTIHDAIHLSHPPSPQAQVYAWCMMQLAARTSVCRFTVSQAARADLSQRLRMPPSQWTVVANSVDKKFSPPTDEQADSFHQRHYAGTPFVLVVGSHRPHKNLSAAVSACKASAIGEVVVPAAHSKAAALLSPILPPDTRVLAPVTDGDLRCLYAFAEFVVCPSLAEGFGLAPLEALACGGTVIATGIPAHREVLGERAHYIEPPYDERAILRAIQSVPASGAASLAERPASNCFGSWDRAAAITLQAWRDALRIV